MKYRYYPQHRRGQPLPPMQEKELKGGQLGCFIALLIVAGLLLTTCTAAVITSAVQQPPTPGSPEAPTSGAEGAYDPPAPFVPAPPKECYTPVTVYDSVGCVPGGERVQVARAVDGDTLELADGRQVRLLGVDSPELGECGYDEATRYTAGKVGSKQVWLFREVGVSTDQYGRELAYVDASNSGFVDDLGYGLVQLGHAELSDSSDANAAYEERIRSASNYSSGPCEQPTYTPAPDYDYDYPNYDYPNPGGENDGGESRLCRGKWYC